MLSVDEATAIVKKNLPDSQIQATVVYRDLYLVQAFRTTPGEEIMDPFYSVHRTTGEFKEFSILTDGNIAEISELFLRAKGR